MTSDRNPVTPCSFTSDDERWMRLALIYSARAQGRTAENPPVGCVLISADGQLLATGHTGPGGRPHAEQSALNEAGDYPELLQGAHAYVTLEPCAMCLGAIRHARIDFIIYGASYNKTGNCGSCEDLSSAKFFNHRVQINGGILQNYCSNLLQNFFKNKRSKK